jgi:hypothetical protein
MTPQEIFDRACKLMLEGKTIRYRYRNSEGCKCVVGHFMDEHSLDQLQDKNSEFLGMVKSQLPQNILDNFDLFRSLQHINDEYAGEDRAVPLRLLARRQNLEFKHA